MRMSGRSNQMANGSQHLSFFALTEQLPVSSGHHWKQSLQWAVEQDLYLCVTLSKRMIGG